MFSQDTDGWPKEYLRMEFRRLREKWWKEIAARYPATEVNRIFQPLNMRLAEASTTRGYMMHGKWNVDRPGVYVLEWWEQKDALRSYRMAVTLAQMRAFNVGLETLFADIVSATEEHGPED